MVTIAVIISIIALIGAGFAFLRASSSHRILVKRIEDLKDKINYQEAKIRKLEGAAGRGNKPVAINEPAPRNQPRQEQPQQEQRHKQRERQQPQQLQQQRPQQPQPEQQPRQEQPQQFKKKKENRRRNEPMETNRYEEIGQEPRVASAVNLEVAGGDLLAELEQQASGNIVSQSQQPVEDSGKRYAIIPEDGVIRLHQLQQRPDSDSYIEVDLPADGSNMTGYRFNLSGNHAFVISQGIDRLENAFAFEKPSNRMVSKVVLQGDGVLTKVNNGWKIQEKARIDFR
ncbi:hypothetical protein [Pontibacter vulgaris]|uniref:hypothetical protein n=1 Tax=Pontibacter vulgaris TaxID=2905679 RepID=UPI001FA7E82B|nr:hypothetical protein [Pontibacter vulgaris]